MKRLIFIAVILAACIFQSWAQSVPDTVVLTPSTCPGVPYYYGPNHIGLIIECVPGLQCVDTIQFGPIVIIIYVNLTVDENPVWHEYTIPPLCQNKSLNFRNNIIHGWDYPIGDTILQYNVPSAITCDTLMFLHLSIAPTYNYTIEDTICLGDYSYFYGLGMSPPSAAGTFEHTLNLQSHYPNLCDSIVTLKLTVNPHKETTIYAEICEGETYEGYGFTESEQGIYTQDLQSAAGCDSTITLILTVHNTTKILGISVCENKLPYIYTKQSNGLRIELYEEGLQIVDTIHTGSLCDSIIFVNLIVNNNPVWHKYYDALCQNETIIIDNQTFSGTNFDLGTTVLQYYLPSAYSCDSLIILHLTVVPAYSYTIEDTICLGEFSYLYGLGLPEPNTAGTFYHTLNKQTHYPHLCDSIITLKLTVNSQDTITIYAGICEGETYSENGFTASAQGTYKNSGTNVAGCDSTTILILEVYRPGENRVIFDTICEGNMYQANGFNVYGTAGTTTTYIEDRETDYGCPYTITLNLTVLLNLKMGTPFVGEICGDSLNFPVGYNVSAGRIDTVFVSFDEKAHLAGFRDFVERNPNNNSIKIPLPDKIRPDNYSVTLYFDGRCSDTTFTVNFTVLYPSSVMEQRWNDVLVLKNPAYNGGYNFWPYEWLVDGRLLPFNHQFNKGNYIYTENTTLMQFGSEYRIILTREDDLKTFCSCPLIPIQHSDPYEFPRIKSGKGKINVYSDDPIVELSLFNILGQTVRNGRYANNEIEINADAGFYIIRLATAKGQIYTQKIVVQ